MVEVYPTSCWECYSECGILAYVENGKVVKIEGNPEHPFNRGILCPKSRGLIESTYDPQRVLYPLKRAGEKGKGNWARISWDEALNVIADRFQQIREKYGREAIIGVGGSPYYAPTASLTLMLRSLGSPNWMWNWDMCGGPKQLASGLLFHDACLPNLFGPCQEKRQCLLIAGANTGVSAYIEWRQIQEAKKRGMRVIVVDPRKTKAAEIADLWLRLRPGTDVALVLAMINVIINEALFDKEFVDKWCYGFDKLREHVQQYPPEKAAEITEIPAEKIVEAARMFATSKPAATYTFPGIAKQVNTISNAMVYFILSAITGNYDVPGGNLAFKRYPGLMRYGDFVVLPQFRLPRDIEAKQIGARAYPLRAGPDAPEISGLQFCHTASACRAVLYNDPYPVRGMFIIGRNILLTYPDSKLTEEMLKKLDFLVVTVTSITPTAELADILLPKTYTFEEDNVFMQHGVPAGHFVGITQKIIEPLGESWSEHKICYEILDRMRQKGSIEKKQIRLPWRNDREFVDYLLKDSDLTFDELKKKGVVVIPLKYKQYEDEGFRTPTGKVELYSTILEKYQYSPLPIFIEPPESKLSTPHLAEKYPSTLLAGLRIPAMHQSRHRNIKALRRIHPDPVMGISSEAAAERGINDGDWAWIETPGGKLRQKFRARIEKDIYPTLVHAAFGWWFPEKPGPDHGCWESNVNALTSYTHLDPILGSPCIYQLACEVTKVE